MQLTPYIFFNGDCEVALATYAGILGGSVEGLMRFSDMPEGPEGPDGSAEGHVSEAEQNLVMHAKFTCGEVTIMASDSPGEYSRPAGTHLALSFPDLEKAQAVFEALCEGGEVQMPFGETFWTKGFGMCRDRFGILWMVDYEPEGV